jgi:hypothetical protein
MVIDLKISKYELHVNKKNALKKHLFAESIHLLSVVNYFPFTAITSTSSSAHGATRAAT